jgi:hypothetical protein
VEEWAVEHHLYVCICHAQELLYTVACVSNISIGADRRHVPNNVFRGLSAWTQTHR